MKTTYIALGFLGCVQNTNLFRFMKQSVNIQHGTFHLYLLLPCLNVEDDQHFFIIIIISSSFYHRRRRRRRRRRHHLH